MAQPLSSPVTSSGGFSLAELLAQLGVHTWECFLLKPRIASLKVYCSLGTVYT